MKKNDDNQVWVMIYRNVVFGWEFLMGTRNSNTGGSNYNLGYYWFAFLESPANEV